MMKKVITYIFANNLLQGRSQILPVEHLDILLNIPWFWRRKSHNELEKLLWFWLRFRDCQRSESFQIPPYSVFLLHSETCGHKLFQQWDRINTRDKEVLWLFLIPFPLPNNAADADTVGWPFVRRYWAKSGCDRASRLWSPKKNQSPLRFPLLWSPVNSHCIQVPFDL